MCVCVVGGGVHMLGNSAISLSLLGEFLHLPCPSTQVLALVLMHTEHFYQISSDVG